VHGSSDPTFPPVDFEHARQIIGEYHLRTLNDMLPATPPSVWGFANVLYERLVMVVPGLISVEVEEHGGPTAVVEHTD
jgi:hypothetical protein